MNVNHAIEILNRENWRGKQWEAQTALEDVLVIPSPPRMSMEFFTAQEAIYPSVRPAKTAMTIGAPLRQAEDAAQPVTMPQFFASTPVTRVMFHRVGSLRSSQSDRFLAIYHGKLVRSDGNCAKYREFGQVWHFTDGFDVSTTIELSASDHKMLGFSPVQRA